MLHNNREFLINFSRFDLFSSDFCESHRARDSFVIAQSFDVRLGTEKNGTWICRDPLSMPDLRVSWHKRMSNRLRIHASSQNVALFFASSNKNRKYARLVYSSLNSISYFIVSSLLNIHFLGIQERRTAKRTCCLFTFCCTLCRSQAIPFSQAICARDGRKLHNKSRQKRDKLFFIARVRFCTISHLTPSREKFLFAFLIIARREEKAVDWIIHVKKRKI